MKTFNETQMSDPWQWCRGILDKNGVTSKVLSNAVDAPRSTIRSLYNGSNLSPRYGLLCDIIVLCIQIENGEMPFLKRRPVAVQEKTEVAPEQLKTDIEDFL